MSGREVESPVDQNRGQLPDRQVGLSMNSRPTANGVTAKPAPGTPSEGPGPRPSVLDRIYARINGFMDAFERADRSIAPGADDLAVQPRLVHQLDWRLSADGAHLLHIRRRWFRPRPLEVRLDGVVWAVLKVPTGRRPRQEAAFDLDGSTIVVAAEWRPDLEDHCAIDVFRDGRSLRSGATLDVSRAASPSPVDLYESVMSGFDPARHSSDVGDLLFVPWYVGLMVSNAWLLSHRGLGPLRWPLLMIAVVISGAVNLALALLVLLLVAWAWMWLAR